MFTVFVPDAGMTTGVACSKSAASMYKWLKKVVSVPTDQ
jgi:hypothetical protein